VQARWTFSLYPQAAEGGGCFASSCATGGARRGQSDPVRSQEKAGRRARAKLRRYCAANRLNRFGTLTYAYSCRDPRQLRVDVGGFFRGLRRELGGDALPYAWTSEWHPGGHGLHVHFAVGRYVGQRLIRDVWGLGIVHIKLIGDLPHGSGALDEARVAASYLAKYVSKGLDDERRATGCIGTRSRRASSLSGCGWRAGWRRKCSRKQASRWEGSRRGSGVPPLRRAGRSRQRCGVRGLTDKQIAEIRDRAVASAAAQGLPAKVQDATILRRVAALVRPGLAAPNERDPGRIKRVASGGGGADDGVVEGRGDDCDLAA
jgi:hypothetical protein